MRSALALLVLLVLLVGAPARADPCTVVFLWPNGTGVMGIVLMQALAAPAVFAFFRKDRHGMSALRVLWPPLLSFLGLTAFSGYAALRFDPLTGASTGVNLGLLLPLPVVFGAGLLVARHIRRTDPGRYARLTEIDVERD
ncbi:hypothetical protein [Streptacidiphilus sp. P02-A3a]|uniref:hypothetical protein n=1 Tax=Streptacidiphilus sp. P02-A3a TaxID=2704468 RepID=UPI0015F95F90|nr:hypothetical protein [Streptacidiphilus sp. P02-A3a]QMU69311.1 hypothetical protein GXP74_14720 [Streptacidiphilus sp. P02-A3a]